MKRYIIIITILFVSACDVLDQEPVSVIAESNFYQNAEQVEAALSAIYDIYQTGTIGRDFFASATAGSDQSETDPTTGGNNNRMNGHAVNADHGPARDLWRESYRAIHRANDVLENLPGIEHPTLEVGNKRDELRGEALFLRGFFYFTLAKWYGPVPLILSTTTSSDPAVLNVPRDELPLIYDQIISDLTEAADILPESYNIDIFTRGRATQGAANGILAKVYLRRAYTDFAGPNDFQNAADRAQQVINNSLYELVPAEDYASMFAADGGNSVESIFEIQTEEVGLNEGDNLHREFERRENGGRARARILPSPKLINAYLEHPGDIRYLTTIDSMDAELNNGFAQYSNKYDRNNGTLIPNMIVLRLADVILVRAEALNQMGMTAEAIQLLNQIRERAQIPPTTAQTQEEVFFAIQDERFLELAFEGKRWHDLSRFPANNYEFARNEFAETYELSQMDESEVYQLLWPINNRELDINDELVQNPGYE